MLTLQLLVVEGEGVSKILEAAFPVQSATTSPLRVYKYDVEPETVICRGKRRHVGTAQPQQRPNRRAGRLRGTAERTQLPHVIFRLALLSILCQILADDHPSIHPLMTGNTPTDDRRPCLVIFVVVWHC